MGLVSRPLSASFVRSCAGWEKSAQEIITPLSLAKYRGTGTGRSECNKSKNHHSLAFSLSTRSANDSRRRASDNNSEDTMLWSKQQCRTQRNKANSR
eukprot:scaffold4477_cov91-Skeletonema_dohrnii-CCMP3373.AAC.2